MKLCGYCNGKGYSRGEGYCICGGYCPNPRACAADIYSLCRCVGKGFVGKIDVKCPVCDAERKKSCVAVEGRAKWFRLYEWLMRELRPWDRRRVKQVKIHARRHTKALKLAKKRLEQDKAEAERKKRRGELRALKKQLRDFDKVKAKQKAALRERVRELEAQLS